MTQIFGGQDARRDDGVDQRLDDGALDEPNLYIRLEN